MESAVDNKSFRWGAPTAVTATIAIYFLAQFLAAVLVTIYAFAQGLTGQEATNWLTQSVVAQFGLITLVEVATLTLLYLFLHRYKAGFKQLGLIRPKLRDVGYALLGFAAYLPLNIAGLSLVEALTDIDIDQKQQLGFENASGPLLMLVFLALVVMVPVTEEILARGFLYGSLKKHWPKLAAVLFTSFLFAMAHLQFGSGAPLLWVAAVDTFILSLVLIYLKDKTGGLAAPIMLHMFKNGLAFTALFIFHVS